MKKSIKGDSPVVMGAEQIPENPRFLHVANHRHENLFQAPIMIGG